MNWWYLSFAGEEGFRGVFLTQADTPECALGRCTLQHNNPGGEVFIIKIPEDKTPHIKFANKLLSKDQVALCFGEECKTIGEWERGEKKHG